MTSINNNFGKITVENGRPRLSSQVFGVDIGDLVKNLADAKRIPIQKEQVRIDGNTKKMEALRELKTLTNAVASAARDLRNPSVIMGGADVFKAKAAFAQSSTGASATQFVRITPDSKANVGKFDLTVNRLATSDTINSSLPSAATTATPLTANGTLQVNGQDIALTSTMSLDQISAAINTASTTTKVRAEVVRINDSSFALSLKSTETGKAIQLDNSTAQLLTDLGLAESGKTDAQLSAQLVYNGTTVTRATNTVKDLVPNVTFDLLAADPANRISVSIEQDSSKVKEAIVSFVDAYNALVDFTKKQRAISPDGTVSPDAVLFNDTTLRTVQTQLQGAISSVAGGVSGLNNLRAAGISLDGGNRMVINDQTLDAAILENPGGVRNLFSFQATANNGNAFVLGRPAALGSLAGEAIDLRVTATSPDGRVLTADIVHNGTTYTANVRSGIMYAPDDSPLKGFAFGYTGPVVNAGDPAQSTVVTPTQGIADKVAGLLDDYIRQNGAMDTAIQELESKNTRITNQITRMEAQVELFKERITAQFLRTEAQVQQLNSIRTSLQAQADAMNNRNN